MNSIRRSGVMWFAFFTVFALGAAAQSPSEVLEKLKASDSIFQAGGSISGTQIVADVHSQSRNSSRPNREQQDILKVHQNWELTFELGRVGYVFETADHEKPAYEPPPPPAASHDTLQGFLSLGSAFSSVKRWYSDGGLMVYKIQSKEWGYWGNGLSRRSYIVMSVTFGPESETAVIRPHSSRIMLAPSPRTRAELNGPKRTLLWSLGRFYSTLIHEVSSVERLPNGRLRVSALGIKSLHEDGRWDFVIEPDAAWMVREARFYEDDRPEEIQFEMVNSGTTWSGAYCIPEEAVCNYFGPIEGNFFPPVELTFDPVVEEFDEELYAAARHAVTRDFRNVPLKYTIENTRVSPTLFYQPD